MINTNIFVAAGLFAISNAHMLLAEPKPFAGEQKSPLSAGQFPCQGTPGGTFSAGANTNNFELGSKQTLKWIGTAVHGGGSCQISISYDTNPTPSSVWKVIHSIEGGCPARGQKGNLPDVGDVPAPDTYDYKIPENIPAGKATISVSWLNRIGNREFYMYCGAVELTGKGGDKSNYEALPDIYVANVPGVNTCETPVMEVDWLFPNPGLSVESNVGPFDSKKLASGCGKFSGAAGTGSGSGSGPGSSYPSASAPASKPSASAPASKPSASVPIPGGAFLTKQPDAAPAPTKAPSAAPVAPAPSSPAAPAPGSGSGSGSSGALSGKCTDGQWNCVGGSSFQQCGSGVWSPVMQMAPGTKCTVGQSSELKMAAAKRVVRVFRA